MWIWVLATVVAYFIKGLCGFANTIVFTSILGFGVNNVNISPVEVVLGYPSNIILICKKSKTKSVYSIGIVGISRKHTRGFFIKKCKCTVYKGCIWYCCYYDWYGNVLPRKQ